MNGQPLKITAHRHLTEYRDLVTRRLLKHFSTAKIQQRVKYDNAIHGKIDTKVLIQLASKGEEREVSRGGFPVYLALR